MEEKRIKLCKESLLKKIIYWLFIIVAVIKVVQNLVDFDVNHIKRLLCWITVILCMNVCLYVEKIKEKNLKEIKEKGKKVKCEIIFVKRYGVAKRFLAKYMKDCEQTYILSPKYYGIINILNSNEYNEKIEFDIYDEAGYITFNSKLQNENNKIHFNENVFKNFSNNISCYIYEYEDKFAFDEFVIDK